MSELPKEASSFPFKREFTLCIQDKGEPPHYKVSTTVVLLYQLVALCLPMTSN